MRRSGPVTALAWLCLLGVALLGLTLFGVASCACSAGGAATVTGGDQAGSAAAGDTASGAAGDAVLAQAFADQAEDLPVEGRGTVSRLLADDKQGERHQRFVVQLDSGQTLLIVHNIEVAPRVASLELGDTVEFKGEYIWNEEGGLIHWTHRDPGGGHEPGWIRHNGRLYQ